MLKQLYEYRDNYLVDIRDYELCSKRLQRILNDETVNFFLFFNKQCQLVSVCDSNTNTVQSHIIFEPPLLNLIKRYLHVKAAWSDLSVLEDYISVCNYLKIKLSGDIWYHLFSVHPFSTDVSSYVSISEPELVYIPSATVAIISCNKNQSDVLYEPFRTETYNYLNKIENNLLYFNFI